MLAKYLKVECASDPINQNDCTLSSCPRVLLPSLQKRILFNILCEWIHYVEEEGFKAQAFAQLFALRCVQNWHNESTKVKCEREFIVDILLEKKAL